ncbi:hypothetical protein OAF61_03075 [Pseudomonadales bacterium]|nr:hypothetical protein [Pseudomonadales bacterium]
MAVFGVSGTDVNEAREGALRGILQQTAGGAANADKAIALAQQLYPDTPKADPYEAAFQFFAEMGRQASQPGATALGSAVGSMQVPMDYLNAKKKEAEETERARMTTALSLGPSLKPKTVGKGGYINVLVDNVPQVLTSAEIQAAKAAGKTVSPYEKPPANTSTFKERKFYKTGLPAAVVKNEADAALFESGGWSAVPPEGWSESVDANGFETQASEIITGGVVVFAGKDGSVKVVRSSDGATLTGDEAQAAIDEAYAKGAKVQGDRSQQRALGSLSSEIVSQSYKEMMTVQKNISTLEDAKRALESGAQTGYFAQFIPDVSASAVELQNVKNRLGLDVVSSVTFGALSESELNMALDTGLPESMDEDYLKGWVQERIDAKKKLLDNLSEAASFLARGNSIGDWLVELDKRATTSQDEITPLATEISTMSIEELDAIDIATAGLSNAELQAYIKRANELGAN